jgi:3-hydroxyacyl-CoA dehydrogenase/enoyl-CoA hydratase/3-hydroxybutyryl-CoA epimerase
MQYIHQYAGGPAGFSKRAQELAVRYGGRFSPPASLAALAG